MYLHDNLYGEFKIESPLIIELLKSPPLLRLKRICQYGIPDEFYHLKNTTRYDHSVGVMLLLRKLGASEEEQVAGLLHDVSHTAFSHLVDWIVGSGETEDYQNRQHVNFIMNSQLAKILKKHGLDPLKVANHEKYPLLEQNIPNLCADRIDYSIKEYPKSLAKKCLSGLVVYKNRIVFNDSGKAKLFAEKFLKRQEEHWGSEEAVCRYFILGNALKFALHKGIIDFTDFWKDDQFIIDKLKKSKDKTILKTLKVLRKTKKVSKLKRGTEVVNKKFRYVDPLVLSKNKTKHLSELNPRFDIKIKLSKKENQKGVRVPIVEI